MNVGLATPTASMDFSKLSAPLLSNVELVAYTIVASDRKFARVTVKTVPFRIPKCHGCDVGGTSTLQAQELQYLFYFYLLKPIPAQ